MQKVIVERPRWGSRLRSRKTAQRIDPRLVLDEDFDSGPRRAPVSRHQKYSNEHLQPLWRFLRSNLGRPWSKVYSEIRSRLDRRGVLGNHLLDHLEWEVETRCFLDGKRITACDRLGGPAPVSGFYVHPKTGLLLEAPRRRWNRRSDGRTREVERVETADGRLFERLDGLWFQTAYATVDNERRCVLKRQCGRKRIREIESWIRNADRGKRGYERGAASVRAPGSLAYSPAFVRISLTTSPSSSANALSTLSRSASASSNSAITCARISAT